MFLLLANKLFLMDLYLSFNALADARSRSPMQTHDQVQVCPLRYRAQGAVRRAQVDLGVLATRALGWHLDCRICLHRPLWREANASGVVLVVSWV